MKATFALLANNEIHNLVRKLSWDIHQKYHTGIDICRIPPHISLKQPFAISDLDLLGQYMTELARSPTPLQVKLTELQVVDVTIDGLETGILWLDVLETKLLRQLHNRLNEELTERFGNVRAGFDGPEYHFHMTVAIGNQSIEMYRKIKDEFSDRLTNVGYTVKEIVMFVYDDAYTMKTGYMTYKVLPIGNGASQPHLST